MTTPSIDPTERFTLKEVESLQRLMALAERMHSQLNERFFEKDSDEILEEARDNAALDRIQGMIEGGNTDA